MERIRVGCAESGSERERVYGQSSAPVATLGGGGDGEGEGVAKAEEMDEARNCAVAARFETALVLVRGCCGEAVSVSLHLAL